MKCITIQSPYAEQIIDGTKRIENRSWGKTVCGRIGIHRGGKNGAILGSVEVIDIISTTEAMKQYPDQVQYITGPLCWILKNPIKLKTPILCRGALSLWTHNEI